MCYTRFPMLNAGAPNLRNSRLELLKTFFMIAVSVIILISTYLIGGLMPMMFGVLINLFTHFAILVGGRV